MHIFRPRSSRILAGITGVLCLVGTVLAVISDGWPMAAYTVVWIALVAWGAWALFWVPSVAVSDSGVQLRNVFRTITISWPAIHAVDTRWSLALQTSYGTYYAWAAPAPGRMRVRPLTRGESAAMPRSSWRGDGVIGYGDLPTSLSGGAAAIVRRKFDELSEAGHLDNPRLEQVRPPVRWHWLQIVTGALLVVGCLLTLLS